MNEGLIEKVRKEVKAREDELISLCSQLIKIPSENPPGDVSNIASFVEEFLKEIGISVEVKYKVREKPNVIGYLGRGTPSLIVCGHVDTVPAGDRRHWERDPFSGDVINGWIYGRGAADMKGGVACILLAAKIISQMEFEPRSKVTIVLVPDEETGSRDGLLWLLENKLIKGKECAIAEPTGNAALESYSVDIGERGAVWIRVKVKGKAAHGSMPMLGDNAILKAYKVIEKLLVLNELRFEPPADVKEVVENIRPMYSILGIERTLDHLTVNIGIIRGGTKVNIVPDTCELEVDIRVPVGTTAENTVKEVERVLKDVKDVEYEVIAMIDPSYTSPRARVVQEAIKWASEALSKKVVGVIMPATSDAGHFRRAGIPAINLGPGYHEHVHVSNEKVKIEDLVAMCEAYSLMILSYLTE